MALQAINVNPRCEFLPEQVIMPGVLEWDVLITKSTSWVMVMLGIAYLRWSFVPVNNKNLTSLPWFCSFTVYTIPSGVTVVLSRFTRLTYPCAVSHENLPCGWWVLQIVFPTFCCVLWKVDAHKYSIPVRHGLSIRWPRHIYLTQALQQNTRTMR
jgi:hypothetical protein